jgi:type I restriction enzyme M protein
MNQQLLEKYLWGAATYLRGHIDAGDYKQFIFPLLFFKRICDVYDEEFAEALAESDGDKDYARSAEFHRFLVPKKHHWNKVRETTTHLGLAIQEAMSAIEKANPDTLAGIFGGRLVDEQGPALRRDPRQPARALLRPHPQHRQRPRRPAW